MNKFISARPLSQKAAATYQRQRRLHDDQWLDRVNEGAVRRQRAKRVASLRGEAAFRAAGFNTRTADGRHADRIAFHLSKGRDVGDIAVREGWLVSYVVSVGQRYGLLPAPGSGDGGAQ